MTAAPAGESIRFANQKLERGGAATPFVFRPLQQELALCQRYYYRQIDEVSFKPLCVGQAVSATLVVGAVQHPVEMRTTPAMTVQSQTGLACASSGGADLPTTAINYASSQSDQLSAALSFDVAGGLATGNASKVRSITANMFLDFDAEI